MIDFNKYNKSGTAVAQPQSSVETTSTPTATATPVKTGVIDFNKFKKAGTGGTYVAPEEKKNWAGEMAKSLVTAPATMMARPLQLGYELVMPGDNTAEIDKFSKEKLGGIVAPIPQNTGDVKKDVGRGVQTVAFGVGSPLAAGAAFGAGSSLEQGNDLFSVQTLLQTVVGAGAGKVLATVGKPIFNTAGKVIGTVTPQFLKDLALKGSGAVEKFMSSHELLGGIAKPLSEKITSGAAAFDAGINKTASAAVTGTKNFLKSQYPNAGKNTTKYFEDMEVNKIMSPSNPKGGKGFTKKAADVNTDAARRGINVKNELKKNKIYASEHIDDEGKFRFGETADALENEAMTGGADFLRPALREAAPGVARVSVQEARANMIKRIMAEPSSSLSPEQKKVMIKRILNEYGDGSVTSNMYKNGYDLEALYDTKLQTTGQIYKKNKIGVQTIADTLTMKQKEIESKVFADLLKSRAPKELGIEKYFKENEAKFVTANYLRTLEGKKAPRSLFQRGIQQASKLSGGIIGLNAVGPFGFLSGYQFGGLASNTFINMSNPVKAAYLKSIKIPPSEARAIMKMFVSDAKAERLLRQSSGRILGGPSKTTAPDLMKMQNETGAVEMGYTPKPTTAAQRMANDMTQNTRFLNSTKQLPAPAPRTIVPNTQGTPNQPGVDYGTNREPGGMYQRIFKGGGTVKDGSTLVKDFTNRGIAITPSIKEEIKNQNFILKKTSIDDILKKDLDLKEFVDNFKGTTKKTTEPIIIGNWQGKDNSVMDGWHRIAALKNSGVKEVDAYISTGLKRIDFTQPASFSKFKTPGKKFMITTTDNPMGKARPDHINAQETIKFRKFLDDNNIHYTPQRGKYGGNPENSNIIEIDNPQQQAIIDRYLQATNPQAENIIVSGDRAVRYDPRTKEAYQVSIKGKSLDIDPEADDFFSEVAGRKYSFPLYGDSETPLSIDEFNKLYNR